MSQTRNVDGTFIGYRGGVSSQNFYIANRERSNLNFWSDNLEKVRINYNGNVGIGKIFTAKTHINQDIADRGPEVVYKGDDKNETLGVRYNEIIPVLTKAIQEQQVIIENLKSENIKLKSNDSLNSQDINKLKAENESFKNELNQIKLLLNKQDIGRKQ